jgi:hypothetical protein
LQATNDAAATIAKPKSLGNLITPLLHLGHTGRSRGSQRRRTRFTSGETLDPDARLGRISRKAAEGIRTLDLLHGNYGGEVRALIPKLLFCSSFLALKPAPANANT